MDNYIFSMALKDNRYVVKRSGETVLFESDKIKNAVIKAMASVGKVDEEMADKIARLTTKSIFRGDKERVPHVDEIHDMVENKLMDNGLNDVAKEYIIYSVKALFDAIIDPYDIFLPNLTDRISFRFIFMFQHSTQRSKI